MSVDQTEEVNTVEEAMSTEQSYTSSPRGDGSEMDEVEEGLDSFGDDDEPTNIGHQILEELFHKGFIDEETKGINQNRYQLLLDTTMQVMQSETQNLSYAKSLNQEAIEHRGKREEVEEKRAEKVLELTERRREYSKAENEVAVAMESLSVLQTTEIELERKKALLEASVSEMRAEKEAEENPIIERLEREVEELRREIRRNDEMYSRKLEEHTKQQELIEKIERDLGEGHSLSERLHVHYNGIEKEPDKARKLTAQSESALSNATRTAEGLERRLNSVEHVAADRESVLQSLNEDTEKMQQMKTKLELQDIPTLEKKIGAVQQDIDTDKESYMEMLIEKQSKESELHSKEASHRDAHQSLMEVKRESEDKDVQLSRKTKHLGSLQESQRYLEIEAENKQEELLKIQKSIEEVQAHFTEMIQSNDKMIYDFLYSENDSDILFQEMQQRRIELQMLEVQIHEMSAEEKANNAKMLMLALEKERCAREASTNKRLFIEAMNDVKVKTFVNREMRKNIKEISDTRRAKHALYSATREERNKLAKYLQESSQTLAQIREKNKILESELEVLTRQYSKLKDDIGLKDRELHEENNAKTKLKTRKMRIRLECAENSEKESEQHMEIRKLNSIINYTEKEMLQLKTNYENVVHDRNFTGIQVIDRNDELCILYEKTNIQDEILKRGELELKNKDEELKALLLEIESLEREVRIHNKQIPDYKAYKKGKVLLCEEIEEHDRKIQELSEALENPQNIARWRNLDMEGDGFLPGETRESLGEKIQSLEETLNMRNEQLMEKNLLLRDITEQSDEARKTAMAQRNKTFNFAANVNKLKDSIKKINYKMMATLSELSVYQATSLNYESSNKELREYIDHCAQQLEQGLPPSEQIQREWEQKQILEQKRLSEMISLQERMSEEYNLPPTVTRTTAFKRPTSYIPNDEFGIPKPYSGTFQPFMFSEPGANMRHYRKPEVKDIVV